MRLKNILVNGINTKEFYLKEKSVNVKLNELKNKYDMDYNNLNIVEYSKIEDIDNLAHIFNKKLYVLSKNGSCYKIFILKENAEKDLIFYKHKFNNDWCKLSVDEYLLKS